MCTETVPQFEEKRFKEIADGVFVFEGQDISLETKIYKYMDLSALFGIMDGHFRISRRKDYSDVYEHGVVTLRCAEFLLPAGESATENDRKRRAEYEKFRKSAANLLCSCFTVAHDEMHCMWKSFTSGYTGIRIETTVGAFAESLKDKGIKLFIGTMRYYSIDMGAIDRTGYIFAKNKCYSPESELRIYFKLEEKTECGGYNQFDENCYLNVDGSKLVQSVLLSPFIPGSSCFKGWLLTSIQNQYPDLKNKISHSAIKVADKF